MTRSRILPVALIVVGVLALAACAPGANDVIINSSSGGPAGFWFGLWHGFISPVTFIVSLFNHTVNIYEVHNNGNWYNFGFMIGLSAIFGGGARGSAGRRRSA
jgi:hypothetical protein